MPHQGKLEVYLVNASGLENTDHFSKMDPYAILTCGAQEQKSTVAKGEGTEPEWKETFVFDISEEITELNIKLMDKDRITKDDFLGETLILLRPVFENVSIEVEPCTYNVMKDDKLCGHMNIGLTFTSDEIYLFPRDFSITLGGKEKFWRWSSIEDSSSTRDEVMFFEVAELVGVCRLDVSGKLDITHLNLGGVKYEFVFVLKLKEDDCEAYGWDEPVNFRLVLSDGTTQEHQECLGSMPRGQWFEVQVGEFVTLPLPEKHGRRPPHHHKDEEHEDQEKDNNQEIEFCLYEHGEHWKGGLVVKGVIVRPKKQ